MYQIICVINFAIYEKKKAGLTYGILRFQEKSFCEVGGAYHQ